MSELKQIINLLASEDFDILENATYYILNSGNGIVKELIEYIPNPNDNIRQNIATCLGLLQDTSSIKILFQLLLDPSPKVQVSAAWALNNFHLESLKQELNIPEGMTNDIEKSLKSSNWQIRWYGINILLYEYFDTDIPWLIKLISNLVNDVFLPIRLSALWKLELLYNYDKEYIKNILIEALGDLNEYIRGESALIISRLKDPFFIPYLSKRIYYDASNTVRLNSVIALKTIGGDEIKPILFKALEDEYEYVRAEALNAFMVLSDFEKYENIYIKALYDKSKYVVKSALENLSLINNKNTLPILLELLKKEKDINKICDLIYTISLLKSDKSIKELVKFINHPSPKVKVKLAYSLGNFKNKNVVKYLLKLLKDSNEEVKEAAILSLGQSNDKKIIKILEKIYNESPYSKLGKAARKSIEMLLTDTV